MRVPDLESSRTRERRAFTRHPTRIPATLRAGSGEVPGTIRDWCRGGLLVELAEAPPELSPGGETRIRCASAGGDSLILRARVARADGRRLGLALVGAEPALLSELERIALRYAPAEQDAEAERSSPAEELVQRCAAAVRRSFAPLQKRFFAILDADADRRVADPPAEQWLRDLAVTLKTLNGGLWPRFEGLAQERLRAAGRPRVPEPPGRTPDALSLVDDAQLEVWLAVGEIAAAVNTENRDVLGPLEQRLSVVLGFAVDESNNPYGPLLFAESFAEALRSFELAADTESLCFRWLKAALMPIARELYAALDRLLVDAGVRPHPKHEIRKERAPTERSGEDGVREPDPPRPVARGAPRHTARGAGTGSRPDLYQLSGGLRELQARLSPTASPGRGAEPAGDGQAAPSASTRELLDLLASVPVPHGVGRGESGGALRERIEAALTARGEGAGKAIGPREGRVIDVTGDVFASLLHDPQLAPGVRPWMRRLELPVLRLALVDEGVFAQPDHVVRGLLNKVAELELLAAEDLRQRTAIRRALEWLLNVLDKEFDGTSDVFRRVAAQLDILLRAQSETFERNVSATVDEFVREEQALPAPEQPASSAADDPWLRRVRRLRKGHWVLFDAGEESQRLKVAWVAELTRRYVFVTALGRKARVESEQPLADLLREGRAVLLDDAEAPAMDRAQFAMLQKLHRQLLYQAAHDYGTGLLNRREFEQRLDSALTDARLADAKHVLCFVGVDQAKMVTASGGYEAGDELMRQLAERLRAAFAEGGELARLESDAFGLLLCRHSIDDALEAIEDVIETLHEYRFTWEQERISVSLSVGLAPVTARSEDRGALLQAAATSCAMAREMGGGRVQVYYPQGGGASRRRQQLRWAARIDKALDEGGLYLRCQKIVPIGEGQRKPHYELLLGLSEELGGNPELEAFVRAAESNGRMRDIDRWVIRHALEWIGEHQAALQGIGSFSVNLSGLSLNSHTVFDFIAGELQRTGAPVEKLCFEVTETAGISNLSDAAEFIRAIKELGCRFSLDDFGSGMSSYAYLKNLPVDYLKIDGAFIRDIAENRDDFAMAKSICDIGHFLGKAVVAEYVHNEATFGRVREMGADFAQGFGVEEPKPLHELLNG